MARLRIRISGRRRATSARLWLGVGSTQCMAPLLASARSVPCGRQRCSHGPAIFIAQQTQPLATARAIGQLGSGCSKGGDRSLLGVLPTLAGGHLEQNLQNWLQALRENVQDPLRSRVLDGTTPRGAYVVLEPAGRVVGLSDVPHIA